MLFAVPFYYLFHSRLCWRSEQVSWVLINPIPIFALTIAGGHLPIVWHSLMFVLGFVAWQAVYEIGYIENDAITVKGEAEPTLRLTDKEAAFIESRLGLIVALRLLIAFLALAAMTWIAFQTQLQDHLIAFVAILVLSRIVFVVHNRIRNRFNVLTFGILSATKYVALPVLLTEPHHMVLSIVTALSVFPIVRTIEHATKNKYGFWRLKALVGVFAAFRVRYYLLVFLVFFAAAIRLADPVAFCDSMVLLYLLVYRGTVWEIMRRKIIQAREHIAF